MKDDKMKKVVLAILLVLTLGVSIFVPNKDFGIIIKVLMSLITFFYILLGCKDENNSIKVVGTTILAFILLTWILPAASFQGSYKETGRIQIGLFELVNYVLSVVLPYFGYIAFYIVSIGCFYGDLNKIPAYRTMLERIVKFFEGREIIFFSVIIILFGCLTSILGIQMGLIIFFPLIASIILMMGYDKIVCTLVLVGSTMIGIAGSTYGHANVSSINTILQLKPNESIVVKVIILLVGLLLLIYNLISYINKNHVSEASDSKSTVENNNEKLIKTENEEISSKKDTAKKNNNAKKTSTKKSSSKTTTAKKETTKKSSSKTTTAKKSTAGKKTTTKSKKSSNNKAAVKDDDVIMIKEGTIPAQTTKKQMVWPLALVLVLVFVITGLALIPWEPVFNVNFFSELTKDTLEFKLFKFPIFGKLLGSVSPFGQWNISDLSILLLLASLLLALMYNVKFNDLVDGFVKGLKKAIVPTILVLGISLTLVIAVFHPFQLPIYKAFLGVTKGFNVVTTSIVSMLASFINGDISYVIQGVIPYTVNIISNGELYPIVAVIFMAIYGVTMLFVPTSIVLMICLSYLDLSYRDWIKAIWKLVLELLVALLVIFTILILI